MITRYALVKHLYCHCLMMNDLNYNFQLTFSKFVDHLASLFFQCNHLRIYSKDDYLFKGKLLLFW